MSDDPLNSRTLFLGMRQRDGCTSHLFLAIIEDSFFNLHLYQRRLIASFRE